MPSTRRQKAKARKSREMDMMSDFENLDVMLGNSNNNPIERELAEAIDQSSTHGDADTNAYQENEYRNYLHENDLLRQNEVRQSFETFSNEFNLRLSQEVDSMMSMMHSQINRAITTAIAERVIPEIQNIANSMSSTGHRDTEASSSPRSQENRESASGPRIKIAKKDSRSVGDLRETTGHDSHRARALRDAHMVTFFFADFVTCANFSNLGTKFLKIQNRYGHHVFAKKLRRILCYIFAQKSFRKKFGFMGFFQKNFWKNAIFDYISFWSPISQNWDRIQGHGFVNSTSVL